MNKLIISATVIVLCAGCSSPDPSQPDKISAKSDGTATSRHGESTQLKPEREEYLRENIFSISEEQFPDNTDIEWIIHSFQHRDHLSFVEVEPRPDTVGYPRFKFVLSFKDANSPLVIATYSLEQGRYLLLSSIKNNTENLPNVLP